MATAISVLGGIGLFLLGMTVMTDGLKALAGSALRTVMAKAAATPLRGAVWGAIITLLVQSSSAVTMTTIGLVSAGLLTFPQGLGLVFGANVGTTGTGWLVALIGVRVSLSIYALPLMDSETRTPISATSHRVHAEHSPEHQSEPLWEGQKTGADEADRRHRRPRWAMHEQREIAAWRLSGARPPWPSPCARRSPPAP